MRYKTAKVHFSVLCIFGCCKEGQSQTQQGITQLLIKLSFATKLLIFHLKECKC